MSILNILNTEILHRGGIPSTQPTQDDNSGGAARRWIWQMCDCKFDFVQLTGKMYSINNYLNDERNDDNFYNFIQWNPPEWIPVIGKPWYKSWYKLA